MMHMQSRYLHTSTGTARRATHYDLPVQTFYKAVSVIQRRLCAYFTSA